MTTGIDIQELEGLADPTIIEELDLEAVITAMRDDLVARFPAIAGVVDLESEPSRKLIEVFAYRETLIRARINDAIRASLLAYANGPDLDHLAAFYDLTRMVDEDDARFRERVVLAIRGRSPGGTAPRYEAVAMEADIRVANAVAYTLDKDPTVRVAVMSTDNGGVASAALLATVQAALDAPAVRMVNDTIVAEAGVTITQPVEANVWFLPSAAATLADDLPALLSDAWTKENDLGFDMTRSWLTARLMVPGVQRVEIVTPAADVVVPPYQSIAMGAVTINDMGQGF